MPTISAISLSNFSIVNDNSNVTIAITDTIYFDELRVGIDNPSIYFENLTHINGGTETVTFNITTEGNVTLYGYPIWFSSSSSSTKHIASNLSNTINTTVVLSVSSNPQYIDYRTDTSSFTKRYYQNEWNYSETDKTITIQNIPIEPATGSNEFNISYSPDINQVEISGNNWNGNSATVKIAPTNGSIALTDTIFYSTTSGSTIFLNGTAQADLWNVTDNALEVYNISTNNAKFQNINTTNLAYLNLYGLTSIFNYTWSNGTSVSNYQGITNINLTIPVGMFVLVNHGVTSYWEEAVNLTINATVNNNANNSAVWYDWLVDLVSVQAGFGQAVLNWVFNLPATINQAILTLRVIPADYNANITYQIVSGYDDAPFVSGINTGIRIVTNKEGYIKKFGGNGENPAFDRIGRVLNASKDIICTATHMNLFNDNGDGHNGGNTTFANCYLQAGRTYYLVSFGGNANFNRNNTNFSLNPIVFDDFNVTGGTNGLVDVDNSYWVSTVVYQNTISGETNYRIVTNSINPSITITYPTATNYTTNSLELNWTYTEANPQAAWYSLNGAANTSVTYYDNTTTFTAAQGSNTIILYLNDTSGNVDSDSITFFVDSVTPLIDFGDGTLVNDTYRNQNNVYINTSWTETNFRNITFRLASNTTTYTTATYTINFTGLSEGEYYYNVTLCDILNQCNTTETRKITLDNTNPIVSITSPTENQITNDNGIDVTIVIADTNINSSSCKWTQDGGITNTTQTTCGDSITATTWTDGNKTVTVYAYDLAGNVNSATRKFFVDTTNPTITDPTTTNPSGGNSIITKPRGNVNMLCFQETANASNILDGPCTLNYTGNYEGSFLSYGSFNGSYYRNMLDGKYGTAGVGPQNSSDYYIVNYTTPTGTIHEAKWAFNKNITADAAESIAIYNFTIPSICWNRSVISLRLTSNATYPETYDTFLASCYNGSTYINFGNQTFDLGDINSDVRDEGIYYNITQFNSTLSNYTYINNSNVNFSFNLADHGTSYSCYQETANVSTSCGGLSTGTYFYDTNYLYINYSKPPVAGNATWQVKHGNISAYNVSITQSCFDYSNPIQLRFYSYSAVFPDTDSISYGQCYNGTWNNITGIINIAKPRSLNSSARIRAIDGNWTTGVAAYNSWQTSNVVIASESNADGAIIWEEAIIWGMGGSGLANATLNITSNITGLQVNSTFWSFSNLWESLVSVVVALVDGVYDFAITVYDNAANAFTSETYQITVDTTNPNMSITSPTQAAIYISNFENPYGVNLTYTMNDTNTDSCWYVLNGGSVVPLTNCTEDSLEVNTSVTVNYLQLFINDSAGNLYSNSRNFSVLFINSQGYNNPAYETNTETFYINVSYDSSLYNPDAKFNFEGVNYTGINYGSGDNGYFLKTIDLPLVNSTTNKTYFWYINDVALSAANITINPIQLIQCNATYTTRALNFTFYDESTNTIINGTNNKTKFEIDFNYWLGSGTIKKSYSMLNLSSEVNNYNFCIDPNETSNTTMRTDFTSEYGADGYLDRDYADRDLILTGRSINVSLYLLPSTLGTKFFHSVRNGIDSAPDKLVTIDKFFTGLGEWITIGSKISDSTGKFVEWLELDKDYRYTITLSNSSNVTIPKKAICEVSPCEITLQIQENTTDIFAELEAYFAQNVVYNLTYNRTTKTVYLTFEDQLGTAQYWRLYVYKPYFNNESQEVICDLKAYSASGTLECNTSSYYGDIYAQVYISRSPEKLVDFLTWVNEDVTDALGTSGLLAATIILLIIIFTGTRSPTTALIMVPFALVILKFIGFLPISWGWIAALTVFITMIAMKMKA